MKTDLIIFILIGATQLISASWGGIVTADGLPPGRRRSIRIWGFVALGALGLALVVAQGVRANGQQEQNETSAKTSQQAQQKLQASLDIAQLKLDQTKSAQDLTSGRISGISLMIREWSRAGNFVPKRVADLLDKLAQPQLQSVLSGMSNDLLKAMADDLSNRMSSSWMEWSFADEALTEKYGRQTPQARNSTELKQLQNESDGQRAQVRAEYELNWRKSGLLTDADIVRQEILRRPHRETQEDETWGRSFKVVLRGDLQNFDLRQAADYLQNLAKRLSP